MNTAATFYYFAYGSNLKLSEICDTCPSAKRQFPAVLPGYCLVFPRKSTGRRCGVAGIKPSVGQKVWGGVYAIPESERAGLEGREGYVENRPLLENAYIPKKLKVHAYGNPSQQCDVVTFVANPQPNPPLPSKQYMGLIIAGARDWGLDEKYIADLEKIRTSQL